MRRLIYRAGGAAAIVTAALLWCCVGEHRCGCGDTGPEWTASPDASVPGASQCATRWWHDADDAVVSPKRLAKQARAKGYTCKKDPKQYERLLASEDLAARSPEEREQWARQVFGLVSATLLDEAGEAVCGAPSWKPGKQVTDDDGVLRYDGTFGVGDGPRVPTYLLLPIIPASRPFEPRAAVVVIHGHDGGRIEVVERPDGYQKAMALRLAQAGYVVLAADNVSWGAHHPLGGGKKPNHGKDFALYMKPGSANGLITWNLTDLFHGVSLLTGLHVARNAKTDRWEIAVPDSPGATPAVNAIAVSGLSYGAQIAAYMALDPRPSAFIVASGLIDTCDVMQNDHHTCQLIKPFEGTIALWDFIVANALLERPRFGKGMGRPAVLVQQGFKDKILRSFGRYGIQQLQSLATSLDLENLEVVTSKTEGHTYLVKPTLDFMRRHLPVEDATR